MHQNLCTHKLKDGKTCNRPASAVNSDLCLFHLPHNLWKHYGLGSNDFNNAMTDERLRSKDNKLDLNSCIFTDRNFLYQHFDGFQEVSFNSSRFEECVFQNIKITNASFQDCDFKNVRFINCEFNGGSVSFRDAVGDFVDHPVFEECDFKVDKMFDFSIRRFSCLSGTFNNCRLYKGLFYMGNARIETPKLFFMVRSSAAGYKSEELLSLYGVKEICISGGEFTGELVVEGEIANPNSILVMTFAGIFFNGMKRVVFRSLKLDRTSFRGSDIENVEFENVYWNEQDKRRILYDEQSMRNEIAFAFDRENLRKTYVTLQKLYDGRRDFPTAEDWHYRGLSCDRIVVHDEQNKLSMRWVKKIPFFGRKKVGPHRGLSPIMNTLYCWASGYGTSYARPLFWFAASNALFTTLYLLIGTQMVNYDIAFDLSFINQSAFWGHLWDSLILSVKSTTFRDLPEVLKFGTNGYRLTFVLYVFNFISNASFLTLFLLALKRRFRRV